VTYPENITWFSLQTYTISYQEHREAVELFEKLHLALIPLSSYRLMMSKSGVLCTIELPLYIYGQCEKQAVKYTSTEYKNV